MSVLIKGMEMPTSCINCPLLGTLFNCRVIEGSEIPELLGERRPDCPLVPVPPHGRLIDADEFYADINESVLLTEGFKEAFNLWFDEQPTIITAEEGE